MRIKWTFEKIKDRASKFFTRNEFKKNEITAYSTACRLKILDEVCSHMAKPKTLLLTNKSLQERALKFTNRNDFQNNDIGAYQSALKRGILQEICFHMTPSATSPYTYEEICEEALKFKTRKEFQKGSPAYKAAWRRDILDQVCSHMPKHVDQSGENNTSFKWTNQMIHEEALKFNKRTDFKSGNPQAYDVAVQRKIMDEVCSHMKRAINVSGPELELLRSIKEIYPSATTYRLRNVKNAEKPHIKGFYLDIYIPEIKKGIEFDGQWHHSIEGLKRSRKNWPIEDILNYHKLKDDHFTSIGIQVIHIKEESWILDKGICIQECIDFLSFK